GGLVGAGIHAASNSPAPGPRYRPRSDTIGGWLHQNFPLPCFANAVLPGFLPARSWASIRKWRAPAGEEKKKTRFYSDPSKTIRPPPGPQQRLWRIHHLVGRGH